MKATAPIVMTFWADMNAVISVRNNVFHRSFNSIY